ncbi:hypothetical protein [Cryobacterium zhongshanensis]|uniref:Uncharacterized protein n=1 Tax=Cryobacterium zhongshanensis TaxID=2928153 RepID=A0AA41QY41_9MICO|nr:hypothetical protein [Cryobacterium zhongshanensis]MCI4659655.1 hypothetical protein [Cryobacterium zhongshanensis]
MSDELTAALVALAALSRGIGEGAQHLTCTEAEALAEVLRAAGHEEAAAEIIEGHTAGDDDPDDEHRAGYLIGNSLPADHDAHESEIAP